MKELESFEQLIKLLNIIEGEDILRAPKKVITKTTKSEPDVVFEDEERESVIDSIDPSALSRNIGYDKYINPSLERKSKIIDIPCGVGEGDFGFSVCGIQTEDVCRCKNASIFALVYNFLIRNTRISEKDYPSFFNEIETTFALDYGIVFRYEMILLMMIKNNLISGDTIFARVKGNVEEFKAAIKIINKYVLVFSRLANTQAFTVKVSSSNTNKDYILSATDTTATIHIENFAENHSIARELWYGTRINYKLGNDNKADLEYLLKEISPFTSFKEGQFQALCSMLNAKKHAVCIMPTGSGKSLIYYFASILQPLPIFVVSPTDILIKDQIRNLERFHRFDNVSHLKLTTDNSFHLFEMHNNILYLTPTTFQNRQLLQSFRNFNKKLQVSYVVLDEIHCLSNWGHDFRPEYLMLSKNLNKFFDRTTFLGFTATANYSVVEDIQKQLEIDSENFFSPVEFEKYNARYDFREVKDEDEMYREVKRIADEIVRRGERAIVFTKSDKISLAVAEAIGYEADAFTLNRPDSYHQFADGFCNILVTNEDLGIGINFPDVNCTVHFGIPISKSEYVQEIGRAGRENERVTSYIVYLNPSSENIPNSLLRRETDIADLAEAMGQINNDYSNAYKKMTCDADSPTSLMKQLKGIYKDGSLYVQTCRLDEVEHIKRLLYMYFVTGAINDWYSWKANDKEQTIDIMVDVSSTHSDESTILERMRNRTIEYLTFMGNDRKAVVHTSRAEREEEILGAYVEWYYEKYLYHHKEMFLDFFEFLRSNTDGNSENITNEIRDFFVLPFVEIKADEMYYLGISFKEAANKVISGISDSTLANIERIISSRYSYQLDFLLFMGNWKRKGTFDVRRLERFYPKLDREEQKIVYDSLIKLYADSSLSAKWNMLNYFDTDNLFGKRFKNVFDEIYHKCPRDHIFYGLYAKMANAKFDELRRA